MIKILPSPHRAKTPRLRWKPDAPRPRIYLAVWAALAADGWAALSR